MEYELLAWLLLAVLGGLPAAGLWFSLPPERRLWPPQRHRAVPWGAAELGIGLFLTLLWNFLIYHSLYIAVAGANILVHRWHDQPFSWVLPESVDKNLKVLWTPSVTVFFQVATFLLVLHIVSGTRLYQVGLTTSHAVQNFISGFLVWLVLTPLVYGVNFLVALFYFWQWGAPPEEHHPLTELAEGQPLKVYQWVLFVFVAVVAAPASEELIFRGILQPWLTRRPWGGYAALVLAFAMAFLQGADVAGRWPVVFILAMVPGFLLVVYLPWRWLPHPDAAGAIYGTALLWAALHSFAWPTPIPLFFLGLGLGFLAYRTQSLVGTITIHSLFNGLTCLALILAYLLPAHQPDTGSVTTSAACCPAAVSISSCVPACSLPLRMYASASGAPKRGE
ncbi:MAG: CPBP family intramembrane metalloprotease [Planctomycetes bacterium]|nr:CPBP family intramembrane metalloprotease [Planctomycetota bacterium]